MRFVDDHLVRTGPDGFSASSMERLPTERAITETVQQFTRLSR